MTQYPDREVYRPESPDLTEEELLEPKFPVRGMSEGDLPRIAAIDRKLYGRERRAYLEEKFAYCVRDPGMNTSLVAEADGHPVGFLLGRLFLGEFGIPATRAVLHTIGVQPDFAGQGIAHALLEQYGKNMEALRVESIHTLVDWRQFELLAFFRSAGFRPNRDLDLVWDTKRFPFSGRDSEARIGDGTMADLEGIVAVDAEFLTSSRRRFHECSLAAAAERPEKNLFLVGRIGEQVAGFLTASIFQGEFGIEASRGVIESFAVGEKHRRHGVASGLLDRLLEWLGQRGLHQIETLCRWNDWELLRFFEYAGFRPSTRLNLELPLNR